MFESSPSLWSRLKKSRGAPVPEYRDYYLDAEEEEGGFAGEYSMKLARSCSIHESGHDQYISSSIVPR